MILDHRFLRSHVRIPMTPQTEPVEIREATDCSPVGDRELIGRTARRAFQGVETWGFNELLDSVYGPDKGLEAKANLDRLQAGADAPLWSAAGISSKSRSSTAAQL